MWGPDAYEFRPERWSEMKEQVESPVGVEQALLNGCEAPGSTDRSTSHQTSPDHVYR